MVCFIPRAIGADRLLSSQYSRAVRFRHRHMVSAAAIWFGYCSNMMQQIRFIFHTNIPSLRYFFYWRWRSKLNVKGEGKMFVNWKNNDCSPLFFVWNHTWVNRDELILLVFSLFDTIVPWSLICIYTNWCVRVYCEFHFHAGPKMKLRRLS